MFLQLLFCNNMDEFGITIGKKREAIQENLKNRDPDNLEVHEANFYKVQRVWCFLQELLLHPKLYPDDEQPWEDYEVTYNHFLEYQNENISKAEESMGIGSKENEGKSTSSKKSTKSNRSMRSRNSKRSQTSQRNKQPSKLKKSPPEKVQATNTTAGVKVTPEDVSTPKPPPPYTTVSSTAIQEQVVKQLDYQFTITLHDLATTNIWSTSPCNSSACTNACKHTSTNQCFNTRYNHPQFPLVIPILVMLIPHHRVPNTQMYQSLETHNLLLHK